MPHLKCPVGGVIEEYKEKIRRNNYFIDIYNFNAHEGSLTPKGAVKEVE